MSKELALLQVQRFELEYEISRAKDALTDLHRAGDDDLPKELRKLLVSDLENRIALYKDSLVGVWEKIYQNSDNINVP